MTNYVAESEPAAWVRHVSDNIHLYFLGFGGVAALISGMSFKRYIDYPNPELVASVETFHSLHKARSFLSEWGKEMPESALNYTRKSLRSVIAFESKEFVEKVPKISELEREIADISQSKVDLNNSATSQPVLDSIETKLRILTQEIADKSVYSPGPNLANGISGIVLVAGFLGGAYLAKRKLSLFRRP